MFLWFWLCAKFKETLIMEITNSFGIVKLNVLFGLIIKKLILK